MAGEPSPSSSSQPAYALHNLLQGGSLTLGFGVELQHLICDHSHAEDGWHHFEPHSVIPHLSKPEDISLCQELKFLAKNLFISATCRSTPEGALAIRIYLIPYDLSNVQGKLRIRPENVVGPAKRFLRKLLPRITSNAEKWAGREPVRKDVPLIPTTKDARTLADIYSDMGSPNPTPIAGYGDICRRLQDLDDILDGLGMRSTLYTYQRRSVLAMLQNELDLRDVPDPLFIPLTTIDKKEFYLQPGTMEILQERPMTASCRGGILCEELGTGKTVMMLALIMATKNQISTPKPSIVDERPILTPLAFRYFPSSDFATSRQRLFRGEKVQPPGEELRVPSLVELLLHRSRTRPNLDIPRSLFDKQYIRGIAIEDEVNTLPVGELLRANVPFYHHYSAGPSHRERTQRNHRDNGPKVMHLTSATLVVVPAILLSQWDREITKHCYVPPRVLILRAKTAMPAVKSLATDYDIILMSYTRFSAEANSQDITRLHSWIPCTCPDFAGVRVPNCNCPGLKKVSPFLQIRWKRLIIDEGHVSATLSTILVPFAKLLSVERRWIVTGTPTTNLLGLSLGNKETDSPVDEVEMEKMKDEASRKVHMDGDTFDIAEDGNNALSSSLTRRIWNKYDREDLKKLGNMITHFVAVPMFNADPKLISTHVIEPLLDSGGPRPGAIQVLDQVMKMAMIRHRIEDVEQDVVLPSVYQESVLLDLDPYVVKSFNALQAIITINAIDSQRTDQDYMFHPRNTDSLQMTVKNMSQVLFWSVDTELYNAQQLVQSEDDHIDTAVKRSMPEEDISSMREAFRHLRLALGDPLWRSMQAHEDVPYRVYYMKDRLFNAWTRTPGREPSGDPSQTGFMHADRLLKFHDMLVKKPLISEDPMVEWGLDVARRDQIARNAYEEAERKKEKRKGRKGSKHSDDATSHSVMADDFAKKASASNTLKEMQRELDVSMARLARDENDDEPMSGTGVNNYGHPTTPIRRPLNALAASILGKTRIGSSASSKLNYIINEVQQHSPTEKFLIFSESPLSLAHVAEALELIQVKFLRFTTQVAQQFREQLVLTFETSETYRVFLMELKHGARGLNLISASRVIFCEPVWQADVESQAIKRAHRIGQTKRITVKTLAIRGTAEENMVARRATLKNSQEKLPKLLEEAGMRHYIANPKFIIQSPVSPLPVVNFPLVNLPSNIVQSSPGSVIFELPVLSRTPTSIKRIRAEDSIPYDPPSINAEESPLKKKKGLSIRFATP
ncbi:hypothetical protein B0H34DRAFT_781279 [Crassisporium funariophilum]|nr:hypothetical protein B0H34DRAFT_781279 [Crassisporium funariophilum]